MQSLEQEQQRLSVPDSEKVENAYVRTLNLQPPVNALRQEERMHKLNDILKLAKHGENEVRFIMHGSLVSVSRTTTGFSISSLGQDDLGGANQSRLSFSFGRDGRYVDQQHQALFAEPGGARTPPLRPKLEDGVARRLADALVFTIDLRKKSDVFLSGKP